MGFNDLPEFPQGGAARAEDGNQGIPPESFQQGLEDAGFGVLTTRRPEDIPAVRAVLDSEVDTLSRAMGHQGQPPEQPQPAPAPAGHTGQPPQAPVPQRTDTAPQYGADLSRQPLEERIQNVVTKYKGNFENLAKSYVHADAQRGRALQEAAGYRGEVEALRGQMTRIENLLTQPRPDTPPYVRPTQPGQTPTNGMDTPISGEEFLANPGSFLNRLVDRVTERTDRVVQNHLLAYSDAQRRVMEDNRLRELRAQNQAEIEKLAPVMDEIYFRDKDIYDALPQSRSFNLILERARERQAAIDATNYHREIQEAFGGNGTPVTHAAPGTTGALPSGGVGAGRRPSAGGITNYSETPAMNRLWRSRSDSREEMKNLTDVLKERGFGEDIPIN